MKKITTILLMTLCVLSLISGVFATEPLYPVMDEAGLLTEQEMQSLVTVFNAHGAMNYQVLTLESLNGESAQSYAERVADQNNIGVLLLVSMEERQWWISTSGEYVHILDDSALMQIEADFLSCLSAGNYYAAFEAFAKSCDAAVRAYRQGTADTPAIGDDWEYTEDFDTEYTETESNPSILICLGIGAVISLITVGVMATQLKSVRPKNSAGNYIRSGSMRITMSRDIYLYQNTVRRAKPQNNSSGGSRSGFSGGGRSHGGRGGSF